MISYDSVVLSTERLTVRLATVKDADLLYALWTNPQVMANVGFPQGLRITRDDIKDRLSKQGKRVLEHWLIIELKGTGQFIGECYLGRPNDEGIAEPDVKLLPAFWRRGYGTELWRALVAYQFEHTDCEIVQGTPNVENVASIRMQESAGAVRVGEDAFRFPESMSDYTTPVRHYVYHVHRADWRQRHTAQQGANRGTG